MRGALAAAHVQQLSLALATRAIREALFRVSRT
jgi:hypothetical protein